MFSKAFHSKISLFQLLSIHIRNDGRFFEIFVLELLELMEHGV